MSRTVLCCTFLLGLALPLLTIAAPLPQAAKAAAPAAADKAGCGKVGKQLRAPHPAARRATGRKRTVKPAGKRSAPHKAAAATRPAQTKPCGAASAPR